MINLNTQGYDYKRLVSFPVKKRDRPAIHRGGFKPESKNMDNRFPIRTFGNDGKMEL